MKFSDVFNKENYNVRIKRSSWKSAYVEIHNKPSEMRIYYSGNKTGGLYNPSVDDIMADDWLIINDIEYIAEKIKNIADTININMDCYIQSLMAYTFLNDNNGIYDIINEIKEVLYNDDEFMNIFKNKFCDIILYKFIAVQIAENLKIY